MVLESEAHSHPNFQVVAIVRLMGVQKRASSLTGCDNFLFVMLFVIYVFIAAWFVIATNKKQGRSMRRDSLYKL